MKERHITESNIVESKTIDNLFIISYFTRLINKEMASYINMTAACLKELLMHPIFFGKTNDLDW